MFQLYDKTRYHLCLAAFAVLCVLPTALVGGWCISRHLPGRLQVEADELGRQLGMCVKLSGFQHLRPGSVLYEGLELTAPETGQLILRCRLLEISRQRETDQQGQCRTVLVLSAAQPELEAAAIHHVWQCLQRTMEGSYGPLEADLRLSPTDVTLRAGDRWQTVTDVEASLETLPGGPRAEARFRLAGNGTPQPVAIRILRNRQVSPPMSRFELDTGGGQLPCNVLALGLEELEALGPRCGFRGCIWAGETPQGWEGEVTGRLANFDFGRLVSEHFPHKLSGTGDVLIESARFCRGRLEEATASVTAGPGTMDRSLLSAAVERLGLRPGNELLSCGERVSYRQLAFFVILDAQGLLLRGRCDETGTILSDGRNRLLGESSQPRPVAAFVQTLVPQSAVQVPGSRQTDWLLRHLPVPDVMPVPGAEAVPPQARLRLKETTER